MRPPRITFVLDPGLTLEPHLRALGAAAGHAFCEVTPGSKSRDWLTADVLRALNKRVDLPMRGGPSRRRWELVLGWLAGEEIEHLFVSDANDLHGLQRADLSRVRERVNTNVWLVFDRRTLSATQRVDQQRWNATVADTPEFVRAWPRPPEEPDEPPTSADELTTADPDELPALPTVDFVFFRAACRDLLDAPDFARVDAVWRRYRDAATALAAPIHTPSDRIAGVQSLVRNAGSIREAVIAVRAAQAALFVEGHFLRIDIDRFVNNAAPDANRALCGRQLADVLAYPNPRDAALAVAALATPATPEQLAALTLRDTTAHGDEISVDGRRYSVPEGAQVAIRAQRFLCELTATDEPAYLFTRDSSPSGQAVRPMRPHGLRTALTQIAQQTGLPVVRRRAIYNDPSATAWARRTGVSLRPLRTPAPRD